MGGTAVTVQAIRMRSMPCMEEWDVVVTAKGGETMTILEFSDNWYKLKRSDGTIGWIYAKNRLKDINAYEVKESEKPRASETPKVSVIKKPLLSVTKIKKAIATIKKNYSDEQIKSLVSHFTAIKTEAPELSTAMQYMIDALQK